MPWGWKLNAYLSMSVSLFRLLRTLSLNSHLDTEKSSGAEVPLLCLRGHPLYRTSIRSAWAVLRSSSRRPVCQPQLQPSIPTNYCSRSIGFRVPGSGHSQYLCPPTRAITVARRMRLAPLVWVTSSPTSHPLGMSFDWTVDGIKNPISLLTNRAIMGSPVKVPDASTFPLKLKCQTYFILSPCTVTIVLHVTILIKIDENLAISSENSFLLTCFLNV